MRSCEIQWIDEQGNPTPDENPAVGEVWMPAREYTREGRTLFFGESKRFPICREHLAQMRKADMSAWEFEVYPAALEDALHDCRELVLQAYDAAFARMLLLFPPKNRSVAQWREIYTALSGMVSTVIHLQRLSDTERESMAEAFFAAVNGETEEEQDNV
jgi:hypothetical protein